MASWRESASQTAQDDLDNLLDASLRAAQTLQSKNGEFYPFAFTVGASGDLQMAAGDPGLGEHPQSTDVIATLLEGLRTRRVGLRAVAVTSDVRLNGSDAIRVDAEHAEGPSISAVLPYEKKRFRNAFGYGQLQAGRNSPRIWTP